MDSGYLIILSFNSFGQFKNKTSTELKANAWTSWETRVNDNDSGGGVTGFDIGGFVGDF